MWREKPSGADSGTVFPYIGDHNADGYADVAILAPIYPDTSGTGQYQLGKVYIYSYEKIDAIHEEGKSSKPDMFKLLQNYPNPFNPSTVIEYQLPKDAHVSIRVYDILGREIATLVDGEHTAGYHEITFNGSRFASGVYFYRLTAPGVNQINKMLMIK